MAGHRPELAEADRLATGGQLRDAIEILTQANRTARNPEIERRLRHIRCLAGTEMLSNPLTEPRFPEPASELPSPGPQSRVPEVGPGELDAELLRAAILEHGCLLVRGLIDEGQARQMAEGIDRALETHAGLGRGESDPDGYYDELVIEPPVIGRPWVTNNGGILAADSPRLMFEMLECFEWAGLRSVIESYLGEPPAISAEKCTLRRATAEGLKAWHQDGKFLGDVRALNVWLSLSRCGDVAPGLDIVPRRLDQHAESGGEGSIVHIEVSQALAEDLAGEVGVVRPIFNPGDALLFDELFLHSTGSDPEMPAPRHAIESWFFGPSAFPEDYVPIAF